MFSGLEECAGVEEAFGIEKAFRIDACFKPMQTILGRLADALVNHGRTMSAEEAERALVGIEDISRIVDHLQVLAAGQAEDLDLAGAGESPDAPGSLTARAEQALTAPRTVDAAAVPGAGLLGSSADSAGAGFAGAVGPGAGAAGGSAASASAGAAGDRMNRCALYLRIRLGISRAEAKRRLVLAHRVLPALSESGAVLDPPLQSLAAAVGAGAVSGRAATIICSAVDRIRCIAAPEQIASMEHHLTLQASESDEDVLRVLARRWEAVLDQDGQEPTEKILAARQGLFFKGRRHGLNILEIGATDEQFEHLATVMNTATNPRTPTSSNTMKDSRSSDSPGSHDYPDSPWNPEIPGSPGRPRQAGGITGVVAGITGARDTSSLLPSPEEPTRAQRLLDGLVGACRIALSTAELPATGGHRPQVMVTIDYKELLADTRSTASGTAESRAVGPGQAVFAEQISARSIRKMACDADIIPLVLAGDGQILDIGRAGRLFPPHLRRALVARDKGCAFPDCTIPASWCEAHHITPWSHGGVTSVDNGVLLCAHHHHVIHNGHWDVAAHNGVPWFTPPTHLHRHGITTRRNTYWHVQPDLPDRVAQ